MKTESIVSQISSVLELNQSEFKLNSKLKCKNSLSNFDVILQKLWTDKMENDKFRYKFKHAKTDYRIIEKSRSGKASLPYILHINQPRFANYKKSNKIPFKRIDEDFNPEKFSFSKLNPDETLFKP